MPPSTTQARVQTITATEVLAELATESPRLALLDPRPPRVRIREHIAVSSPAPFQDLEQRVPALVGQPETTVVLTEDDDIARAAAGAIVALGYRDVRLLEGGLAGWKAAGGRTYQGTNVRSKTFGEWIEQTFDTPTVEPEQVAAWRDAGQDVVVLDTRTRPEYLDHHIPGGVDTGGAAELVLRARQLAPSPQTAIVVNCQGRTRGIVGAQTIITGLGRENVWFLRNGTPQWRWADLPLEHGPDPRPLPPHTPDDHLVSWATETLHRHGVQVVGRADLERLFGGGDPYYVFDVRSEEEFQSGHVAGSRHVPGGVLLQESDEHVAIRGATLVLVDNADLVRAATTAQWLPYLHPGPIVAAPLAQVPTVPVHAPAAPPAAPRIDVQQAAAQVAAGAAVAFDLRPSTEYAAGHLPGSVHARREHLVDVRAERAILVGAPQIADRVAHDLAARGLDVAVLVPGADPDGFTAAEPRYAGEIVDQLRPEGPSAELDDFIRRYFDWEYSLVPSSQGDPHFAFDHTHRRLRAE